MRGNLKLISFRINCFKSEILSMILSNGSFHVLISDLNRVPASGTIGGGKVGVEPSRRPQALPTLPPLPLQASTSLDVATTELRQAALGVQALGVLVNYLVFNVSITPNILAHSELNPSLV